MQPKQPITISGLLRDALISDDVRWAKIQELAGDRPEAVFRELPLPELRGLIDYLAHEIENDVALYYFSSSMFAPLLDFFGTGRFHGRNLALSRLPGAVRIADYVFWSVTLIDEVKPQRMKLEYQMARAREIITTTSTLK